MQFKLNDKSEAGRVAYWEANVSFSVRQGWTIKCHPKTYSSGSLLKGSAIPKVLNFLPAYYKVHWLCQWGSLQCQAEDTCAPRNHLHTWYSVVLWLAKCIWINLHPSNVPGSWTSASSTSMPCSTMVPQAPRRGCTHTRALVQIQEHAFVPHVCFDPCFARATSEHVDRLASRSN